MDHFRAVTRSAVWAAVSLALLALLVASRPRRRLRSDSGAGRDGRPSVPRWRRGQYQDPGSLTVPVPGRGGPDAAAGRPGRLRPRPALRPGDLLPAEEPARAPVHARDLRADLRDLQDLPDHPGQVHPAPGSVHRRHHRALLRGAPALRGEQGRHHPPLQPHRHRRLLRGGVVRHPDQHLRELPHRLRQPGGQAVSRLRHPAQGGHEHRDAAHLGRALPHALHPPLHSRRLRRLVLHRLRHRRIAGRRRAPDRGRHLHQDRRHRLRSDEDRLQHQGRRRAQPGGHRRLHRRQRGRLGGPQRGRLRDLRRHRGGAHLLHHPRGEGAHRAGPAPGLDLHHARADDRGLRRLLPPQRGDREGPLRERGPR